MKKILLATTAVVALSTVSAEAFAAEKIKLSLGGFMRQYVGVSNNDEVAPASATTYRAVNLSQAANSEVYFRGATTLDNGLNVSTDIQMESSTRNGQGDTSRKYDVVSMEISSDAIGAITIGSAPHSGDDFLTRAPNANASYDWGDLNSHASVATTAAATSSAFADASSSDITGMGGKGLKLKYVSPNFSGVNVHASYAANTNDDNQIQNANNNATDAYTYGVAFGGEVGGAAVSADVTHALVSLTQEVNHIGVSVGMAGFTVGGGYSDFNDLRGSVTLGTGASEDGKAFEIGVGYETGPYSLSVAYLNQKQKATAALTGDNEDTKWQIAATYDMGAGVALSALYYNMEATTETVATTDDTQVSGVIAGIEVGF